MTLQKCYISNFNNLFVIRHPKGGVYDVRSISKLYLFIYGIQLQQPEMCKKEPRSLKIII